jgi:hypothetical protein
VVTALFVLVDRCFGRPSFVRIAPAVAVARIRIMNGVVEALVEALDEAVVA